jgi:hypothetical protein
VNNSWARHKTINNQSINQSEKIPIHRSTKSMKIMLPYPHSPPQVVPPGFTHWKFSYNLRGNPFKQHGICCICRLWNHVYESSDVEYSNSRKNLRKDDEIDISSCSCQILLKCSYISSTNFEARKEWQLAWISLCSVRCT